MKFIKILVLGCLFSFTSMTISAAVPNVPIIAWMPDTYDDGNNINVVWNMWWGENGTSWSLSDNGLQICQGSLTPNGQNEQMGSCSTNFATGNHELSVSLCSVDGCSISESKTFTVVGGVTNASPLVSLSTPTTTNKGAQISLSAEASDSDGSIAKVDFYSDGSLIASDTSSPYQINYIATIEGTITLVAKATDDQGATSSATSNLLVSACSDCNEAPQISVTVPGNIQSGDSVLLQASANDVDGSISQVVFMLDSVLIETLTQAPYQYTWMATVGDHTLEVIATDNDGASTSSMVNNFAVTNDSTVELVQPGIPQIAWLGEQALVNGSADFTVTWNMWYGENGNKWRLLADDVLIAAGDLATNSPNAQLASTSVSLTTAGNHSLVIELCNITNSNEMCSTSNPVVVSVTGGDSGGNSASSPWDYLDNSEWLALKESGLPGNNISYENNSGKRVASYFVEWGVYGRKFYPKDVPVANLTHLIYGFIPICGPNESLTGTAKAALDSQCANKQDYEVVVHDKFAALEKNDFDGTANWNDEIKGIFAELYRMKMTYPELKIIPSVGGWTLSDPLYDIGSDAEARAVFIASIIDFIDTYDFFDGIDIDWEFPGGGGANPALGSPEDGAGFATLMEELRTALDALGTRKNRSYELMAAVSGGVGKVSEIDWERAIAVMDHVNLMTYDYYGAWSQTYGHQTGVYGTNSLATPIDGFSVDEVVTYLTSQRQVPANKLSVGVAMYGRGWTGITGGNEQGPFIETAAGGTPITGTSESGFWEAGIVDYKGIEANQLGGANGTGSNGYQLFWDEEAKASYLWNFATGTLISFDDKRSVLSKGQYINDKGLGGIFSWEIDADSGTLLNTMHQGLGHTEK